MCKRYITASDVLLTFLLPGKGLFLCFFCHAITILLVELSVCLTGQNDKIRIDSKHPFIELLNYLVTLCSANTPILTDFCNIYIHLFIHRLIPPFLTSMSFENICNYYMRTFLYLFDYITISFLFRQVLFCTFILFSINFSVHFFLYSWYNNAIK